MKNKFLRFGCILFLGFALTTITSCSSDDNSDSTIYIKEFKKESLARNSFEINPEISAEGTTFSWFDNQTQKVISTAPVLNYVINNIGNRTISLKTVTGDKTEMYRYNVTTKYGSDHNILSLKDIPLTIETVDGKIWTNTFVENTFVENLPFTFSHIVSTYDANKYWSGFTVSNSTDKADHKELFSKNMYGTTANNIKVNSKTKEEEITPFLVVYSQGLPKDIKKGSKVDLTQTTSVVKLEDKDGKKLLPITATVAMSPYTFYSVSNGDQFGKKFGKGDFLNLLVFGLDENGVVLNNEPITHKFVDFTQKVDKINKEWSTFNLEKIGAAKYLVFYMDSSDKGENGINTPLYFTMNELVVYQMPK